ncbi:MAG: MerR family transcriptional regulator [Bacillota bacterium]|nr:MerR family transcriptional regulator [Bacillota bacterium]
MKMNKEHMPCEPKASGTLYRIGMFAAMNHVTVKALRFYEEQGLLEPAFIQQENGYRYYTLNQIADLHQISALKQAGFTLEEIGAVRTGADEGTILLKKKAELMTKIAQLAGQVAVIDRYLAGNEACLAAPVLVKTIPECKVAYMQVRLDSYDCLFEKMPEMGALMERTGCLCALPEYCFTGYLEAEYKEEGILVEICEAVADAKAESDAEAEAGELKFKTIPEVKAACIFHRGSYSRFPESYERVLRYIEENNLEICGPIRESYIDGVWNKDDESQWLSEIQVPVR